MPVASTDGPWGELDDFIVDPTDWHVAHLAVQPHRHHEPSHLVTVSNVAAYDETLELTLSAHEIQDAPLFEVTEFVKMDPPKFFDDGWTTDANPVTAWPYYPHIGLMATGDVGTGFISGYSSTNPSTLRYVATTFEHLPDQEISIRRSSQVISSDDHKVGTVDGFVLDDDGRVTHLVLDQSPLWRHREITIPIGHVREADENRVLLDAPRDAVGSFPSIRFHRYPLVTG